METVNFVGTKCFLREESKMNKNYDAMDIIDMVEEAAQISKQIYEKPLKTGGKQE